ncbi:apolipoprotein N-acyltransferase [Marinitoga hydrogenitolerans DSM 16785]|uniref:Apolipoprotein N-acyltransferase n=1 Tax=Marinitoga hydrogenitolerans (strain DSM 16785 / JCM 12826 / AT1271) TaxID=1122195 RepID=A0A1M4UKC1_MARH1|nr:apolipoprotein N-acyltransferase [Marinitoga hydrogenitolerans]SHE57222.1 apolipoprotein N-acyltransferase [Marinitoga hydrogenitolerans DSM 16785]
MNYLLPIISGVLTGLAMPGNLFSFLIWFSVAPFLYSFSKSKGTFERLFKVFLYSYSLMFSTLWWEIPVLSKNIPEVINSFPGYIGFFSFLLMILILTLPYYIIWFLGELYFRKSRVINFKSITLFSVFSYAAAEVLKQFGDFAFTGGNLSDALYLHTGFLQILPFTGTIGLTILILLVNSFIAFVRERERLKYAIIIIGSLYVINFAISEKLPLIKMNENAVKISVFQTNVPQEVKYSDNMWNSYVEISNYLQENNDKTDLLILPEAIFIKDIRESEIFRIIQEAVKISNKNWIIGFPIYNSEKKEFYNSALYLNKSGEIENIYNKIKLMPFAEFLPYENIFRIFSFFKLVNYYTPGSDYSVLNLKDKKFSVQICFETYFPEVSRNFVKNGAQFLIAISNDGWFSHKTALLQHFSKSVLRAAENRRTFIQVSNTGITGIVDKYGRIVETLPIKTYSSANFNVPIESKETFYTKYANIIIIIILILAMLFSLI